MKSRLLLHVCCGSCATHVIERLKDYFDVELFYSNPNISPEEEYNLRLQDVKRVAEIYDLPLHIADYKHDDWLSLVRGFEKEPEGGQRCGLCFRYRLEETARKAKELGMDVFATTLTVSPHKDSVTINQTGKYTAVKNQVDYLLSDFKKNDGFKKSVELSRKYGLNRQSYCGCEFSQ